MVAVYGAGEAALVGGGAVEGIAGVYGRAVEGEGVGLGGATVVSQW